MIRMRELKNYYCRLDEKGEHLENTGYIFTYGYGANGIGGRDYIRLDHIIENMQLEVNKINQIEKEHIELFKNWENDKTHEDYYIKEDKRLSDVEDNLYKYYYESVFAILTQEEVNQIQKKINYNFMSESFINEVIKYLTTNKLEKIS
jgi:hypothetical protein